MANLYSVQEDYSTAPLFPHSPFAISPQGQRDGISDRELYRTCDHGRNGLPGAALAFFQSWGDIEGETEAGVSPNMHKVAL